MKPYNVLIPSAIFFLFAFCSDSAKETNVDPAGYKTTVAFPRLSFTRPVDLQHSGDNTNRIFVVEQAGIISVFPNDANTSDKKTFLDIRQKVDDQGNEEGLLGLAFHPDYESNGYFYVNYTASNPNRTVISRFRVSGGDPNQADRASEATNLRLLVLADRQQHPVEMSELDAEQHVRLVF